MMNVLEPQFQSNLLRVAVQDTTFLQKNRHVLTLDLFRDPAEREVFRQVVKFYDEYGSTPSRASLLQRFTDSGYEREDVEERLKDVYDVEVKDSEFVQDKVIEYVKKNALQETLLECNQLLDKGDFEGILDSVRKVTSAFSNDDEVGDLFFKAKKNVLRALDIQEDIVPTGFHWLDEVLSGGPRRGTLNVVVTPPNKGKTTMLINIGKYAALSGHKVVHYTLELSSKIIMRRYFMSMVRMTKAEMTDLKKTAYDRICQVAGEVCDDSIIIKQFTSHAATLGVIRKHLQTVKNSYGFFPDVVIIDYGDLIKSARDMSEKRHELADIFRGMRDIGTDFNSVVWTATQTNRGGNTDELITINDLSECFEKAAVADTVISLNQTLGEKRANPPTARLFMAKSRDDASLVSGEIITEWDRCWCGNLDE